MAKLLSPNALRHSPHVWYLEFGHFYRLNFVARFVGHCCRNKVMSVLSFSQSATLVIVASPRLNP